LLPSQRQERADTGKRRVVIGAMGKLTVVVSSALLIAIITAQFSTLDAWLFVTNNLP
jgi:hypothetical protein